MNKVLVSAMAAALAVSFAAQASATTVHKKKVSASIEQSCKQQAAKKFTAIHFLKRRSFANDCMAKHARVKAKPAAVQAAKPAAPMAKPATTGQSVK